MGHDGLLTIGEFARAAGLTPKALRLYGDLRLLSPAAVDAESGYRFYLPDQLARAKLIAALRRVGMPLAEISHVCALAPAPAAEAVAGYWRRVSDDTAARARQVALLVEDLTGRGITMTEPHSATPAVRYATGCDTGAVRDSNEDTAYASDRLFAVADGARGPGGAAASTAAVDALRALTLSDAPPAELLTALAAAVTEADRTVRAAADGRHQPVTTLTAILRSGSQLALVHVGDTRAYLLRGGELIQLTTDHTYVQSLVDQGRLSPDEAAAHPRRALLARALGAGGPGVEADLALRTALAGDRYLLCSDGLSSVVDRETLRRTLTGGGHARATVGQLIEQAYAHGAPDNIACVVADLLDADTAGTVE